MKTFAGRKLGRPTGHRMALLRNLAVSLLQNEKLETTLPKAKELSRFADKIITMAKREGLNSHRSVARFIKPDNVRKKVFDVLVPRYQSRHGGYTQIIKSGRRMGDAAEMAVIRLMS